MQPNRAGSLVSSNEYFSMSGTASASAGPMKRAHLDRSSNILSGGWVGAAEPTQATEKSLEDLPAAPTQPPDNILEDRSRCALFMGPAEAEAVPDIEKYSLDKTKLPARLGSME